jgi:hypothetical protein
LRPGGAFGGPRCDDGEGPGERFRDGSGAWACCDYGDAGHVEAGGIAEDDEQQHRHHDHHGECAVVAAQLPELFDDHRPHGVSSYGTGR